MNNIMQVNQISKTMSSREIAVLASKDHSHVIRDIRSMLSQIDDPNMDDVDFKEVFDNRGYTSEINLNKDLTLTLVAGYNSRFRYAVIKRWQELETSTSQPVVSLPCDYISALEELLITKKCEQIALEQVKELQPKAAALDFISAAVNSLNARDTAKNLGVQPQKFNKWCIAHNWMYRDGKDKLQMCSKRLQQGFMEQRPVTYTVPVNRNGVIFYETRTTTQPLFTAKGLTHLAKTFAIVHEVA